MRLDVCRAVALEVKKRYPSIKTRINTNGQSDLIFGKNTAQMYRDAFDTVSISLNSATADGYSDMCRPVYGKTAFDSILTFAKNVNNCVHNVAFTVVREFLAEGELELCYKIAEDTGVPLRVRTYIGKES